MSELIKNDDLVLSHPEIRDNMRSPQDAVEINF